MTDFDNAAHLHMHQAVRAFKAGNRERLEALVMRLLVSGDMDIGMVDMVADELSEAQFDSFRSCIRGLVCENRAITPGGQCLDFGVFAIPYESAAPLGPFLSDTDQDALMRAMRGCELFDVGSQVFLMERVLSRAEVGMISESAVFEYGVNTSLMVASDMEEDAQLAAVDLVSDINPRPPRPMTTGIILGVRVMETEPGTRMTHDRIFFAADYELDDEDYPWNDRWNSAVAGLMSSRSIRFSRPRPWARAHRPQVCADMEPVPAPSADDQLARLVTAALPFATAGQTALDVRPDEGLGWVWGGKEQNARIHSWFGPSDFGNLMAALGELGVRIPDGETG